MKRVHPNWIHRQILYFNLQKHSLIVNLFVCLIKRTLKIANSYCITILFKLLGESKE